MLILLLKNLKRETKRMKSIKEKAEKYGCLQLGIYQLNSLGTYVWKGWIYADTYVELYENYTKYCLENLI